MFNFQPLIYSSKRLFNFRFLIDVSSKKEEETVEAMVESDDEFYEPLEDLADGLGEVTLAYA